MRKLVPQTSEHGLHRLLLWTRVPRLGHRREFLFDEFINSRLAVSEQHQHNVIKVHELFNRT